MGGKDELESLLTQLGEGGVIGMCARIVEQAHRLRELSVVEVVQDRAGMYARIAEDTYCWWELTIVDAVSTGGIERSNRCVGRKLAAGGGGRQLQVFERVRSLVGNGAGFSA